MKPRNHAETTNSTGGLPVRRQVYTVIIVYRDVLFFGLVRRVFVVCEVSLSRGR